MIAWIDEAVNATAGESWDAWVQLNYQLGKDSSVHGAAALVERACAQGGTLVDVVEAVAAGETQLRVAIHQLGRLRGVLADLAREFGPRPATVLA